VTSFSIFRSGTRTREVADAESAGMRRQLLCDSCCILRAIIDWVVGRAKVGMEPSRAGLIMQISRVGGA